MKGKEGKLESTIFKRLLKSGVWWHTLESQHLGVGGRVIETSRPVRNTRGAVKKTAGCNPVDSEGAPGNDLSLILSENPWSSGCFAN